MRGRPIVLSVLVALASLTLCAVAFVPGTFGQATQGEYKIGVLEPLTGPLAFEGKRHLDGYEVMRDLINAQGGVMGKKLVFVVGDATDPTAAASEANRLITREGVKIITGTYSSTLCGAASEAASRQNVIYWESSGGIRASKRGGSRTLSERRLMPPVSGGTKASSTASPLLPASTSSPTRTRSPSSPKAPPTARG